MGESGNKKERERGGVMGEREWESEREGEGLWENEREREWERERADWDVSHKRQKNMTERTNERT